MSAKSTLNFSAKSRKNCRMMLFARLPWLLSGLLNLNLGPSVQLCVSVRSDGTVGMSPGGYLIEAREEASEGGWAGGRLAVQRAVAAI